LRRPAATVRTVVFLGALAYLDSFDGKESEPVAFVVARLREFQARAKKKMPAPGTMTAVAVMLSDMQIEEAWLDDGMTAASPERQEILTKVRFLTADSVLWFPFILW
jgi:hypothetical protein